VSADIPKPGTPVSYDEHIRPLFREHDHESMRFAFDLWSYEDVSANATAIFEKLSTGAMPCDGAWPSERVELFRRWMDTGMRETASDPVPAAAARTEPSGAPAASVEAIEGRLRSVLDLRSEQHVDERAIVIEHRSPLIYMLCAAAELEHALMCEYLGQGVAAVYGRAHDSLTDLYAVMTNGERVSWPIHDDPRNNERYFAVRTRGRCVPGGGAVPGPERGPRLHQLRHSAAAHLGDTARQLATESE